MKEIIANTPSTGVVVASNENMNDVIEKNGTGSGYCTYRDFYAKIEKRIESDEFLDENIYFKALLCNGIIVKGKYVESRGAINPEQSGYTAPLEISKALIEKYKENPDKMYIIDAHMIKRGSFGFNCSYENMEADVIKPTVSKIVEFQETLRLAIKQSKEMYKDAKEKFPETASFHKPDIASIKRNVERKVFSNKGYKNGK